jgi:two-component system, NarL family, sensor histidine kinase UhpB
MLANSSGTPDRTALSIRALFLVIIGTLALLALAMSGLIVFRLVASLQDNTEKELERGTRDIAYLVDREISGVTNALAALAATDDLRPGDVEGLYKKSVEVGQQIFPDFFIILYQLHRDEHFFNTRFPFSAPIPQNIPFPLGEAAKLALLDGKAAMSDVFFGPRVMQHVVIVCVPVRESAGIQFALCGNLSLEVFAEILKRSRRDDDWIVTVTDRKGTIVARSRDNDRFRGQTAASLDLIAPGASSGKVMGNNAEGVPFVWAYNRMESTGWLVGVGVPRHVFESPMLFGLGGMLVIGIAVVFGAALIANRASGPIARSMDELRDAVSVVRHGPGPALPAIRPASYREISSILTAASAELLAREGHRQFVISASDVGTWQWNLVTGKEVWSDRYREIIGVSPEVEPCLDNLLARVHPSDRAAVREAVTRHACGEDEFDREYRIVRTDNGEERWVRARARLERDAAGKPARVLGVGMDVTVLKHNKLERDELRRRLMHAQEDERNRLARELHDETGQVLVAAMLDLKRLEPAAGPQGAELLGRLRSQLDQIDASLHRVARELRPASIDDLGVAKALADHIADWSERFGIEVDYHCLNVDLDALPADLGTVLFRICQEALTNIAKHATGATDIGITVDRSDRMLRMTIEDNGGGFDPPAGHAGNRNRGGLGIAGVRERLKLIGGELLVESSIGVGTTIFVRIALEPAEAKLWPAERV